VYVADQSRYYLTALPDGAAGDDAVGDVADGLLCQ
jgi:hypothetical protein